MEDFILEWIGNEYLAVFVMAFVPLIELKGAILVGRIVGLGFLTSLFLSFIGSTLVFIPIYFLLKPLLNLMKKIKWFNKFACKVEDYFEEKAQSALNEQKNKNYKKPRSETFLKQLGVFIFVAIPLPMTGVWTGTAIAVFLGLKFKECVLPVALGNLVAGMLISILAAICKALGDIQALNYVLYGLFGLALILFLIVIVRLLLKKPKEEEKKEN